MKELRALASPDKVASLQPDTPSRLGTDESQPFTIVFSSVPKPVADGDNVKYGVEVAKKIGAKSVASGDSE
jgi:hypothetical protein